MRILLLLVLCTFLVYFIPLKDSPHGRELKISCNTCHSPKSWQLDKEMYSFNHDKTRLPLIGQHKTVNCRQCHISLVFSEARNRCNECHEDLHQTTAGTDCSRCHTPSSWLVNRITDIHNVSRFPLLGAHKTADCIQCHKSESLMRFDVIGINCIDCHRENYLATTNPSHIQSGYPDNCTQCHSVNAFQWTGAGFVHTQFPLNQGHSGINCEDCHKTNRYSDAKSECYSCHSQDFLSTTNPDHNTSRFSTLCQECHTLSPGWKPVTFSHNSFPLTQGHSTPACIDCHKDGNYTSTPKDCYTCHKSDYAATKNPNHSLSGIASTCQTCHSTNPGWKPATFNHTSFPLTLGHSTPVCSDCHVGGNYSTTSKDCYACHTTDYNGTTNPNHSSAGFPVTCTQCHTTSPGWKPATFSHTKFPLTLGHSTPACADCHKGGNYATTPNDCFSCHQADFNNSTNPGHQTLGFSTLCTQCHTTNPGWKPASYTAHDSQSFPIYSGRHNGRWNNCTDCHLNPANYAQFTCTTACHPKSSTDSHHSGNKNYSYVNAACYQCHPRGNAK
jgi:nitrate/TMAO reductase-like tetraheme cytochrome c subunit